MCAKTRLDPPRPPLGHLPEPILAPFGCFRVPKRSQNCKKNCTKNDSIFDHFLNQFWTSFGDISGPQTEPRIHPKSGPEKDQKRAPKAEWPKMDAVMPLGSNLLFLTHSNDLLKFCKAFTQFVNEPRFGHLLKEKPKRGNWVALGCFGLIWAALAYFWLQWAA